MSCHFAMKPHGRTDERWVLAIVARPPGKWEHYEAFSPDFANETMLMYWRDCLDTLSDKELEDALSITPKKLGLMEAYRVERFYDHQQESWEEYKEAIEKIGFDHYVNGVIYGPGGNRCLCCGEHVHEE